MSDEQQFDLLYNQILQQGKGIEPLFQSLYSFLRRKTDFFKQPEEGFAVSEKAFKAHKVKFEQEQQKEKARQERENQRKKQQEVTEKKEPQQPVSSGVKEITKEEFERRKLEEEAERERKNNPEKFSDNTIEQPNVVSNSTLNPPNSVSTKKVEEEDDEDKRRREKCAKMDESLRKELLQYTAHLDDKNGGRTRNYTWVQHQVEQFEMYIPVDQDTKGNQVQVDIDSKKLKVVVKGQTLLNGELFAAINVDSFLWTLDEVKGKKVILITFDKIYKMQWWDYVIKGDELLTLSKVNPDPSKLSDLDPSMRPEIEKMMIENSMKMQGKPFHKDPKTNDMLNKFMKEHPEMDFSKAQIS